MLILEAAIIINWFHCSFFWSLTVVAFVKKWLKIFCSRPLFSNDGVNLIVSVSAKNRFWPLVDRMPWIRIALSKYCCACNLLISYFAATLSTFLSSTISSKNPIILRRPYRCNSIFLLSSCAFATTVLLIFSWIANCFGLL